MYEAYDHEARYAVSLDGDGNVTEGRGWNIFALEVEQLVSTDEGVLEGVTPRTIVELAESLNIKARLGRLSAYQWRGAEEIFLISTVGGIVLVKSVNGIEIGEGGPGPVTQRLTEMYWNLHEDDAYSTPGVYRN